MSIRQFTEYLGKRRVSHIVNVGGVQIGGASLPVVQSMNNVDAHDVEGNIRQLEELAAAGCQISRISIPDMEAAECLEHITRRSPMPIVADIHFDYRLALAAIRAGAAKIRINPGNIGGRDKVRAVVRACREASVPVRVGVNSGSLSKELRLKYGGVTVDALCESAMNALEILENEDFDDIVLSLKASDPAMTIACYRKLAKLCDYPLHIGVTEAGTAQAGALRSAVGIGTLLAEGIGDTLRVSLTADPVQEVEAAFTILNALHLAGESATLIACPTCGRTRVDLIALAAAVEERLKHLSIPVKVAVMGCAVNGPGEAREADIGIAGGVGEYILFSRGRIICRVPENEALDRLMAEIESRKTEFLNRGEAGSDGQ